MTRILYVIHQFYPEFHSGTERFLLNLSSALQKVGHFPQVVTYTFGNNEKPEHHKNLLVWNYAFRNIPVTALRHKTEPMDLHLSCYNEQIYKYALSFLPQDNRCDLVHITHSMRLASFAKAAIDLGIPYVLTLTDFWLICPKIILQTSKNALCAGPMSGKTCSELCPELSTSFIQSRLDFAREVLHQASGIAAPSRFLASIFKQEFPALNIRVIPHGMDSNYLKPNLKFYDAQSQITFGYCGGLSPHKGVHILLQAFRNIDAADARLKLYGAPFQEKDYFDLLRQIAGNDGRISFCGTYKAEAIGDVLADIDVMVAPSLCYESYGLAMHEALACNVPVIASNIGGAAEVIQDSVNGFTFYPGDVKDLESKMKHILDDTGELNIIKSNLGRHASPLIEEEAYLYERLYNGAR
jgi:glycosyltransferase involved in cell wall biosynthesis